jgi:hypothetical protein
MEKLKKIIITVIKFPEIPKLNGANLEDLPFDIKNEITTKTYIRLWISAILGASIACPFFLYTNNLFNIGTLIALIFAGIYFYGWIYFSG